MKVEGEAARSHRAVRLDSCENVSKGELVSADDITGEVVRTDKTGERKMLTLGPAAIRILSK
jgi:hypothetical protein